VAFSVIKLENHINLFIKQDIVNKLRIEANENLLPFIVTDFFRDTLHIYDDNRCEFLRNYKNEINVYVSVKKLDRIWFNGSGKVFAEDTIISDKFYLDLLTAGGSIDVKIKVAWSKISIHTGPGDIKIAGISNTCSFYSASNGFIDASELITKTSYVHNKGTGDFTVNVNNEMGVEMNNTGSVFCYGNPNILYKNITGKGELIKL
jgi:hypothetical protein